MNALGHCHPAVVRALEEQARELWHVSNLFFNPRAVELAEELTRGLLRPPRLLLQQRGRRPTRRCSSWPASTTPTAATRAERDRRLHQLLPRPDALHAHRDRPGEVPPRLRAARPGGAPRALRRPGRAGGGRSPRGRRPSSSSPSRARPASSRRPPGYLPRRPGQLSGGRAPLPRRGPDRHGAHRHDLGPRVGGGPARPHELRQGARRTASPWARCWPPRRSGRHLTPGSHASTFGGDALACAVALATLREIRAVLPARREGRRRASGAASRRSAGPRVVGVRGRGMLLGVLVRGVKAGDVVAAARERGLLVNAIGDEVIRLAPALILTEAEADEGVALLAAAIAAAPAATMSSPGADQARLPSAHRPLPGRAARAAGARRRVEAAREAGAAPAGRPGRGSGLREGLHPHPGLVRGGRSPARARRR